MAYSIIRPKRGTTSEWEAANPILKAGEMGLEFLDDSNYTGVTKVKFGDGVTNWNDLPYGINYGDMNICAYYGPDSGVTCDTLMDESAIIVMDGSDPLYTTLGTGLAYVFTNFYDSKTLTSNRLQVAYSYNKAAPTMAIRCYINGWTSWQKIATNNDIASAVNNATQAMNYASSAVNTAGEAQNTATAANSNAELALSAANEANTNASDALALAQANAALIGSSWEDVKSSFQYSVSSGNCSISGFWASKKGDRYHIAFTVKTTAAITENTEVGKLSITGISPVHDYQAVCRTGSAICVANFNKSGTVTITAHAASVTSGSTLTFNFEYSI